MLPHRSGLEWQVKISSLQIRHFKYASTTALPAGPALAIQSAVSCSPIFLRPAISAGLGGSTFMPLAFSCATYQPAFSSAIFRPRASAAAAAFNRPSWVALSRLANAALLTNTTLLGIQALQ